VFVDGTHVHPGESDGGSRLAACDLDSSDRAASGDGVSRQRVFLLKASHTVLLRVSSDAVSIEPDLEAVVSGGPDDDAGVPAGSELRRFARTAIDTTGTGVETARSDLADFLGREGLVDAAAVVAFFNAFDRVADATGTALDAVTRQLSGQMLGGVDLTRAMKSHGA
jgi:hypothetical protein